MVTKRTAQQAIHAEDTFSRRTFLGRVWLLMGTLTTGEAAFLGLRYFGSRRSDSPFGSVVDVGRPDDFPPGTITDFPQGRFYLVRFEDGGFLAVHTRCTHLACRVSWDEDEKRFICPCHGSQFDLVGDVLNDPAPRPLDCFPVTLSTRKIEVNTEHPIQRTNVSDDDLVYLTEE